MTDNNDVRDSSLAEPASITINGRTHETRQEFVLEAMREAGVTVPTLCKHPELTPTGACRLCVVEVEGQRNLVPSCAYPVQDGMKVVTHSPRALQARKTIVELLLADHPDDCLRCVRNNECALQDLAAEFAIRSRRYSGGHHDYQPDLSSPAITRDAAKCVLCGKCVRVCEEIQSVGCIDFVGRGADSRIDTAFEQGLNVSSCVNCGQCIMVCPTGALRETSSIKSVLDAIHDPEVTTAVQIAPAVSVTLEEHYGLPADADAQGVIAAALRRLGFDYVFDTSFSADLTVMEEGSELISRIENNGPLPQLSSCSPGWIKFVEEFYPDFLDNLSTCKSPQQMLGALVKTHFADKQQLEPEKVFHASVMPCTAKKFEALRPEMARDGQADVDAVLTTRELMRLIKLRGLDMRALQPEALDAPFGLHSSAGKLFAATGGVCEAAARTAYKLVTGEQSPSLTFDALRGAGSVKMAQLALGELQAKVAVVSGLENAKRLLDEVRAGEHPDLVFIEVMTCPGGCIAGGGQPIKYGGLAARWPDAADTDAIRSRMDALYHLDAQSKLRTAHDNEAVQQLYEEFLGAPLSAKSHELLHTHYHSRDVVR
jgi:iron-only hydrogenase group A